MVRPGARRRRGSSAGARASSRSSQYRVVVGRTEAPAPPTGEGVCPGWRGSASVTRARPRRAPSARPPGLAPRAGRASVPGVVLRARSTRAASVSGALPVLRAPIDCLRSSGRAVAATSRRARGDRAAAGPGRAGAARGLDERLLRRRRRRRRSHPSCAARARHASRQLASRRSISSRRRWRGRGADEVRRRRAATSAGPRRSGTP